MVFGKPEYYTITVNNKYETEEELCEGSCREIVNLKPKSCWTLFPCS